MAKLTAGDSVAYSAKFLKSSGQQSGSAGARRGVYIGEWPAAKGYGRVKWDDVETLIALGQGDFAEADYCAEIRANGSPVPLANLAKIGSGAFALNDL